MFIGCGIILLVLYISLIRKAGLEILSISASRDKYKEHADIDRLTNAYSRLYLDTYINQNEDIICCVVLLDLDNLKYINDT